MEDEAEILRLQTAPRVHVARKRANQIVKNIGITTPPVSLWRVIASLQESLNLFVEPYDDFGERVSGIIVVFADYAVIGFNTKQHWHRRRFTIAHEIGHLLLGHLCQQKNAGFPSQMPEEREANIFAAELLMPYEFLKKDFVATPSMDILSEKYRVSDEALGWKIAKSGLLTK